jgi:hypothetical protein
MPRNGPFGGCSLISSFCTHNVNSYCIVSWRPICQHDSHFLYALLKKKNWTFLCSVSSLTGQHYCHNNSLWTTLPPPKKNSLRRSPIIHQRQSSIGVWAGIVSDYFVCLRVLLHRFTGTERSLERYARSNTVRESITCLRDGGPYSANFRKNCHDRWISRGKLRDPTLP